MPSGCAACMLEPVLTIDGATPVGIVGCGDTSGQDTGEPGTQFIGLACGLGAKLPPGGLCCTFKMHFITHLSGLLTGGFFFIVQVTNCRLSLIGIFAISVKTMGSLMLASSH